MASGSLYDPNYRRFDIEGYRVYRGRTQGAMELLAQFDYTGTYKVKFAPPMGTTGVTAAEITIPAGKGEDAKLVIAAAADDPNKPGNEIIFTTGFPTESGRGKIVPAKVIPPEGGETEFIDTRVAWDHLPKGAAIVAAVTSKAFEQKAMRYMVSAVTRHEKRRAQCKRDLWRAPVIRAKAPPGPWAADREGFCRCPCRTWACRFPAMPMFRPRSARCPGSTRCQ